MKKNFSLLLSILCLSGFVGAQSRYTSTIQNRPNGSGIPNYPICNIDSTNSIAFYLDQGESLFSLINHSDYFNNLSVPIPPLFFNEHQAKLLPYLYGDCILSVNDIYVVDNYAFFCGSIIDTNHSSSHSDGVYGYVDLNYFYNGSTNIPIFCRTINTVTVLYRLVAFKYDNKYKIVAYGDDISQHPYSHYDCFSKVIEVSDVMGSTICDVATFACTFNAYGQATSKQFVDDIFLTEKYVVFTRHNWYVQTGTTRLACFSFGEKGHVVHDLCSSTGMYNYYIPNNEESNDIVIGTSLEEDRFAMAYLHNNGINNFTKIRCIDIPSMDNYFTLAFPKPEKENPERMIYYPELKTLVLLQKIYNPQDFAYIQIVNSSITSIPIVNPYQSGFQSLQKLGNTSFITTNGKTIFAADITASLPYSNAACPFYYNMPVFFEKHTYPIKDVEPSFSQCSVVPTSFIAVVSQIKTNLDCLSIENDF
ncbi:MAG: hypothetical protein IKM79_04920 [Bacteroidales bacterium]|nr:hypothetical protein [Bacteroidales bacterium]